jgi:hypothetical protein
MSHRYISACLLLILGFSGGINCMNRDSKSFIGEENVPRPRDGKVSQEGTSWVTLVLLGIAVGYPIVKELGSYMATYLSSKPTPKNVITAPTTFTQEQIEFQKVQKFFDACELQGVKNKEHHNDDYNEFIKHVDDMNNKDYKVELSKVLLDCTQNKIENEIDPESDYQRFSRCLEHANKLAPDKIIPQDKEVPQADPQN